MMRTDILLHAQLRSTASSSSSILLMWRLSPGPLPVEQQALLQAERRGAQAAEHVECVDEKGNIELLMCLVLAWCSRECY